MPLLLRSWVHFGTVALVAGAIGMLSACAPLPQQATVDFAKPRISQSATPGQAPPPVTGSLFNTATYRPSFEDRRARQVGDVVTIQIAENVSASQKSTSTVDRTSSISSAATALPLNTASGLGKFDVGAETANKFAGKGGTESANTFEGSITATVVEVLPNGHLIVIGEKQIGVNQNVDVLRFSGTIDPLQLQPGSIIASTQVADVRVESKGRGAQNEAQTVGWLSRFFLSFSPF